MSTLAENTTDTGALPVAEDDHSGRPRYDDVNVPFVVVLGVVSAIITYVCIVGVQGLYYHFNDSQIRKKEYGATIAAAKTIEEQKESLNNFNVSKVDPEQKSIPIELAMKLTLAENKDDSHESDKDHGNGPDKKEGSQTKEGDEKKDNAGQDETKKTDSVTSDSDASDDSKDDEKSDEAKDKEEAKSDSTDSNSKDSKDSDSEKEADK